MTIVVELLVEIVKESPMIHRKLGDIEFSYADLEIGGKKLMFASSGDEVRVGPIERERGPDQGRQRLPGTARRNPGTGSRDRAKAKTQARDRVTARRPMTR